MRWDLAGIVDLLLRRGWIILLVMLITGTTAYALTSREQEKFSATTVMMITAAVNDSDGLVVSQSVAATYRVLIETTPFLNRVIDVLNLPFDVQELQAMLSTESPIQPHFIELTVTDTDAQRSALIAETIASEFEAFTSERLANLAQLTRLDVVGDRTSLEARIQEIDARLAEIGSGENVSDAALEREITELTDEKSRINASISNIDASVENVNSEVLAATTHIEIIEPATIPSVPSQPRPLLVTVFGIIMGFIIGVVLVGIITVAETMARTKDTPE